MLQKTFPLWAKEIKEECAIQFLLSGHFTHPTISDCLAVGHSTIRLFSLKSNQIYEKTKYIHNSVITSACVIEYKGKTEVGFLSNSSFSILSLNSEQNFTINETISLETSLSFLSSYNSVICMYDVYPSVTLCERETMILNRFDLQCGKIFSCEMLKNNNLCILELANIFQICIYKFDPNINKLKLLYKKPLSSEIPYKVKYIPEHSDAIYLLSENKISKIKETEKGYFFDPFPLTLKQTDPLIVDAAALGQLLLLLTADGIILKFDGKKFEKMQECPGAMSLCSLTINRFTVAIDSDRIILYDKDMTKLSEVGNVIFRAASYKKGNFVVCSGTTVHSAFYDYGIEIDKVAEMTYFIPPKIEACGDYLFVLFQNKTVVLEQATFKDVTPSFMKTIGFERIHANSLSFIFAVKQDSLHIFHHGQLTVVRIPSTHSCFHHSTIYLCEKNLISCYNFSGSDLSLISSFSFPSQISAIGTYNNTNACIALFDGSIFICDDDLDISYTITLENDLFATSVLNNTNNMVIIGTNKGTVLIFDSSLKQIKKIQISSLPCLLKGTISNIIVNSNNKYYEILDLENIKTLPPDFLALVVFQATSISSSNLYSSNSSSSISRSSSSPSIAPSNSAIQVAITKSPNKEKTAALLTFHFTHSTLGFHSQVLFEFNGLLDRICAGRTHNSFVASIRNPPTLFWSKGSVAIPLEDKEIVRSIVEWKANHGGKRVTFWVACTEGSASIARLLLFTQSKDTQVHKILAKVFGSPITSFSIVNQNVAIFSHSDQIVGISLETGSLRKKFSVKSPIPGIVHTNCNQNYIVAITNQNGFFCMKITNDSELKDTCCIRKPLLGSRIKIVKETIIISDRIGNVLFYTVNGKFIKQISFISPVSEMFATENQVFCCHLCGEMTLLNIDGTTAEESSVSSLFSFGHSAFTIQ